MNNGNFASSSLNLSGLEDEFIKSLAGAQKSNNTQKNYRTDLNSFDEYLNQNKIKQDIDILSMHNVLQYSHYLDQKYHSDNSKRRKIQTLRIFFDYLVKARIISSNPLREIQNSPKFLDIPRPASFIDIKTLWVQLIEDASSEDEMASLIAMRNQLVILLIFGAALKVSTLSGLLLEHLYDGENPRVLVTDGSRDPYSIPLPNIFSTILAKYKTLLEKLKLRFQLDFPELLFNANHYRILAGGLSPRGLELVLEEYRDKLMINITPKSLRQAGIFKWLHQKKKESQIKEWLGVAPSYSLAPYKELAGQNVYSDVFLAEIYNHYEFKNKK
ncbi:MAG: hypothetical protein A2504_12725 [Bdellovibrionales bacterium RIFOXYD12_FULL_39_22]|nr:MAG: hypothetical protein A2385_03810 [Bdellovibrionales bacterium RIFOXYB1_FULL_39_21]OFZ40478.1 MAG: hypothetical protein A2485_02675 [Bdellovibrionales bacterium RIFOXYC12_FULL_39_17]OFZ49961.1 MAG: hypothetical protein A2404_02010 [Bdellovibrionales bacterium RIFOXYC1_FULL_39_130]OFZ77603.1 MAG: hypothetical protein A2560_04570 [Bdellovibrionales bacterium RIFOXYD1_FULL_39_84]OFZ96057.1 MAG: hypothetical protein A2504_12725 [Bdellovibrionales bacterium RIFOXYD12_FULL_39_22]HLE10654.1 si